MKETWRSGALGSSWGLAPDALSLPEAGPAPDPPSPSVLPGRMLAVRLLCCRSRAEVEAVRGLCNPCLAEASEESVAPPLVVPSLLVPVSFSLPQGCHNSPTRTSRHGGQRTLPFL